MKKRGRYTLMVMLVLFVFLILLGTMFVVGLAYLAMYNAGVINQRAYLFPLPILALLAASIAIGTSLTALTGKVPLRPFHKLTQATREIAAGNFDVRIEMKGPKELENVAESFNEMAEALGSIETLRTDFVSNVSHEFKTPVNAIRGFAKLLKKDGISDESRQEYLDIIIMESERLSKLSGNVLLLSKLDSEEALGEDTAYRLDEQVRRSILLLEPEWGRKGIEMDVDLPPVPFVGQEALLEQVWVNLIGNAIKFTATGGMVSVSLSPGDHVYYVRVSDTGAGMDEETLRHVWDRFFQGDRSHATEGNGLGLSLVSRILDLCGGAISVRSAPGEGSTFTVSLPRREA